MKKTKIRLTHLPNVKWISFFVNFCNSFFQASPLIHPDFIIKINQNIKCINNCTLTNAVYQIHGIYALAAACDILLIVFIIMCLMVISKAPCRGVNPLVC